MATKLHIQGRGGKAIMADRTKHKCAHPCCQCEVMGEAKYCSAYCEKAKDEAGIACACGHAGCASASKTLEPLAA